MKTIMGYLEECKEMAWHNRLCYSKTYSMDTAKDGYEKEFSEAVRDCEIVDELIALVNGQVVSVDIQSSESQTEETKCPDYVRETICKSVLEEIHKNIQYAMPEEISHHMKKCPGTVYSVRAERR